MFHIFPSNISKKISNLVCLQLPDPVRLCHFLQLSEHSAVSNMIIVFHLVIPIKSHSLGTAWYEGTLYYMLYVGTCHSCNGSAVNINTVKENDMS